MYLASSGIYTQVRLKPQIQNLGLRDQIFTTHDCPNERENFNFVYNVITMDDYFQRILINRINKFNEIFFRKTCLTTQRYVNKQKYKF